MKTVLSYLLLGILWCLHCLPLPMLRGLGWALGHLLYALGRERREVALVNLRLCFPQRTEAERKEIARKHFVAFSRAVLDRTLGWWASKERIERLVRVTGREHLHDASGRPILILAPHFVGLDAGAVRISIFGRACSVYSNQKNPVFNKLLYEGRRRFSDVLLLSRQDGMRKIVRAMKDGYPLYYLPDMDFGPEDSIFVPFFGVQAATIPGVSRLVRLTGAKVVACITRQVADGYEVEIMPAWDNFPGASVEADTEFVNRFIESQVLRMPEQYFWLHKRFKTRPPGEQRFYK